MLASADGGAQPLLVTEGGEGRLRVSRTLVGLVGALAALVLAAAPVTANHDAIRRISAGQINGNGAFLAGFRGTSADGSRVWFSTEEQLVAGDLDAVEDVYERFGGRTRLVSDGAINGDGAIPSFLQGHSADGSRLFFSTSEQLVSGDTDGAQDIYQRMNGVTTRISAGAVNGNGEFEAQYVGNTPDGTAVFFETDEQLVSADTDDERDVYRRRAGTTTLMSVGGTDAFASFMFASTNGNLVVFLSNDQVTANDTDENDDVFVRSGTSTVRASIGTINGNGDFEAEFGGASSSGARIFFETEERLRPVDTDDVSDVYQRFDGKTSLISQGPNSANGDFFSSFHGNSTDGTRVFFSTPEQLVASDSDSVSDIYMRQGTTTTRVSVGAINGSGEFVASFRENSSDGSVVVFATEEALVAGDTDSSLDVYRRAGGVTSHVSTGDINGDGAFESVFRGMSANGSVLYFETQEALVTEDTDNVTDVYSWENGETFLMSIGNGNSHSNYAGCTPDGRAVFWESLEQVMLSDTDTERDVYGAYDTR